MGGLPAHADQIRMKDGTKLSGTVLQRDGEHVVVLLPRASVESVDGQALPPPVIAGSPAPEFTAVDLDGATRSLAENRGHVTLLQFWASWCPHCRSDLPLMKKLFAQYREQGLRLLTVSVDQDPAALQTFIQKEQLSYPVLSAVAHPALPDLYETQGIPAYFLIDADGTIVKTWSGSVTERPSDFEDVLTRLLAPSGT